VREGWAWVSLGAASARLSSKDLLSQLPRSHPGTINNALAIVDFDKVQPDASLSDRLAALREYLTEFRGELLGLRPAADFELRVGWLG